MKAGSITVRAPAKINLYLAVGARRDDGYHDVTTVLQSLELHDTVRIAPAAALSLTCDAQLGIPAEENLAYRAAVAFEAAFGIPASVAIALEKRIPPGAGLGGGSADAAAVLAGLAHLGGVPADSAELATVARALGADVPYFFTGGAALFEGRGDRFVRRLPFVPMPVVLIQPAGRVVTVAAYAAFDHEQSRPTTPGVRHLADAVRAADIPEVARQLFNNMTAPSSGLVAGIADALAWVHEAPGVLGAAMAGSGSSVFGICSDVTRAQAAADAARARGWWAHATRTTPDGVVVLADKEHQ
jgi:4-diphosphocytidyl-2-C-methyl-D-erythritol kinase